MKEKLLSRYFGSIRIGFSSMYESFLFLELNLISILLYMGFVFTMSDAFWVASSGFIYVNGIVVKDPYFCIKKSDRVQFILDTNLYLFFRETRSDSLTKYYSMWELRARILRIRRLSFKNQSQSYYEYLMPVF